MRPGPGTEITTVALAFALTEPTDTTMRAIGTWTGVVSDHGDPGDEDFFVQDMLGLVTLRYVREEGIWWIYGRHAPESVEARALQASFVLAGQL